MILYIIAGAAVAIVAFIAVASLRPSEFSVTRSTTSPAPAEALFPLVNNLRLWNQWSPWAKMDPGAKNTFAGPGEGIGSVFTWEGGSKTGAGSMKIVDSQPSRLVRLEVDFLRPMKARNVTLFTFQPLGSQTKITWTIAGPCNLKAKILGLFFNCEKMCGRACEQGLASMTQLAETAPDGVASK